MFHRQPESSSTSFDSERVGLISHLLLRCPDCWRVKQGEVTTGCLHCGPAERSKLWTSLLDPERPTEPLASYYSLSSLLELFVPCGHRRCLPPAFLTHAKSPRLVDLMLSTFTFVACSGSSYATATRDQAVFLLQVCPVWWSGGLVGSVLAVYYTCAPTECCFHTYFLRSLA